MRKAFQGDLARSEASPELMCFGFVGNIKSLLEIWEASVVLCVSAEEAARQQHLSKGSSERRKSSHVTSSHLSEGEK